MNHSRYNHTTSGRRVFLKLLGAFGFLLGIPSWGRAFFVSVFPTRTVEKEDFTFDPGTGMVKWNGKEEAPYHLLVNGLVEEPKQFSYTELLSLPQVTQVSDFHCVEGWSVRDVRWGGFRFEEIAKRVSVKPGAGYAVFHALGETTDTPKGQRHYLESFPMSDLLDPKRACLMVLFKDGKPLTHDRGAPLRVITPSALAYKSIKYVTRIEFTQKPQPGWWTLANPIYPIEAPVPASRLRGKDKSHGNG